MCSLSIACILIVTVGLYITFSETEKIFWSGPVVVQKGQTELKDVLDKLKKVSDKSAQVLMDVVYHNVPFKLQSSNL